MISYETIWGKFSLNKLTMGSDGSSVNGIKFHTSSILNKIDATKDKWSQLVLWQKTQYANTSLSIEEILKKGFENINNVRNDLRNLFDFNENKNIDDLLDNELSNSDNDIIDDELNTMVNNNNKLENQIEYNIVDGSVKETNAIIKIFKDKQKVFKCLEHGKCDWFIGLKLSIESFRNMLNYALFKKGLLYGINIIFKSFGEFNNYEFNHYLSIQSFMNKFNKDEIEIFTNFHNYPKTREKNLSKYMFLLLKAIKYIKIYMNDEKLIWKAKIVDKIIDIINDNNIIVELYTYLVYYNVLFKEADIKINQKENLFNAGQWYMNSVSNIIFELEWNINHDLFSVLLMTQLRDINCGDMNIFNKYLKIYKQYPMQLKIVENYIKINLIISIFITFVANFKKEFHQPRRRGRSLKYHYKTETQIFEALKCLFEYKLSDCFKIFDDDEIRKSDKIIISLYGYNIYIKMYIISLNYISNSFQYIAKKSRDKYDCLIKYKNFIFDDDSKQVPSVNDAVEGSHANLKFFIKKKKKLKVANAEKFSIWEKNKTFDIFNNIEKDRQNKLTKYIFENYSIIKNYKQVKKDNDILLDKMRKYEEMKIKKIKLKNNNKKQKEIELIQNTIEYDTFKKLKKDLKKYSTKEQKIKLLRNFIKLKKLKNPNNKIIKNIVMSLKVNNIRRNKNVDELLIEIKKIFKELKNNNNDDEISDDDNEINSNIGINNLSTINVFELQKPQKLKNFCFCGAKFNKKVDNMIYCNSCHTWFHTKCIKMTNKQLQNYKPDHVKYICHKCKRNKKNKVCTKRFLFFFRKNIYYIKSKNLYQMFNENNFF